MKTHINRNYMPLRYYNQLNNNSIVDNYNAYQDYIYKNIVSRTDLDAIFNQIIPCKHKDVNFSIIL